MHQREEIIRKTDRHLYKFENTYNCCLSLEARTALQEEILTFSLNTIPAKNTQRCQQHIDIAHRIALARLRLRFREFARRTPERGTRKGDITIIRWQDIKEWIRTCGCWPRGPR